jgi:hypothetical protein
MGIVGIRVTVFDVLVGIRVTVLDVLVGIGGLFVLWHPACRKTTCTVKIISMHPGKVFIAKFDRRV